MSPKGCPCLMHAGSSTEAQEQGAGEMEHVGRPWGKATRPQVVLSTTGRPEAAPATMAI